MRDDECILTVEEMTAYEEFTDRVEILRDLEQWMKNIQRMAASSTALIAPHGEDRALRPAGEYGLFQAGI